MLIGELAAIAGFLLLLGYSHLPRTVVPFVTWGILSLWMQGRGRRDVGVFIPREWPLISIVGLALGVSSAVAFRVLLPVLAEIGLAPAVAYSPPVPENALVLIALIISMWLLGAVGEEFFYRGFLTLRLGDLFGTGSVGVFASLVVSALIFAIAHEWLDLGSGLGFILLGIVDGVLYIASGRNLLLPVLFHGSWDTVLILFAWARI